jgi:hypothetical protein
VLLCRFIPSSTPLPQPLDIWGCSSDVDCSSAQHFMNDPASQFVFNNIGANNIRSGASSVASTHRHWSAAGARIASLESDTEHVSLQPPSPFASLRAAMGRSGRPPLPPSRGGGERPSSQMGGCGLMLDGVGGVGASGSLGGYTSDSAVAGGRIGGGEVAAMKQKFVAHILFSYFFRAQNLFQFSDCSCLYAERSGQNAVPQDAEACCGRSCG